jgi:hypothetical protein
MLVKKNEKVTNNCKLKDKIIKFYCKIVFIRYYTKNIGAKIFDFLKKRKSVFLLN